MTKKTVLDKKGPAHNIANPFKKEDQIFKCRGCEQFFKRAKQCGVCSKCPTCCDHERAKHEG